MLRTFANQGVFKTAVLTATKRSLVPAAYRAFSQTSLARQNAAVTAEPPTASRLEGEFAILNSVIFSKTDDAKLSLITNRVTWNAERFCSCSWTTYIP